MRPASSVRLSRACRPSPCRLAERRWWICRCRYRAAMCWWTMHSRGWNEASLARSLLTGRMPAPTVMAGPHRHGRPCAGHPRLLLHPQREGVDGRAKPGHDDGGGGAMTTQGCRHNRVPLRGPSRPSAVLRVKLSAPATSTNAPPSSHPRIAETPVRHPPPRAHVPQHQNIPNSPRRNPGVSAVSGLTDASGSSSGPRSV
jgi:hypothetical protein